MIFKQNSDKIFLAMAVDEYYALLAIIGYATGAAIDEAMKHAFLEFANEMNRTNPQFRQYEIPEQYRGLSKHILSVKVPKPN